MKTRLIGGLALIGLAGVLADDRALAAAAGTRRRRRASRSASRSPATARTSGARTSRSRRPPATKYGVSLVGPISSNGDAGKQATQIRTLIDQGVNALIINPVDSAAIAPTLAYAASKHIPVVSVDVAPTKGKVYMIVRADNMLYGQSACNYIGSHAKGSGHVAMLEGDLASINGLDRKNGFLNCMKANYPNLKVVEYATKWDTPTAVNDAKTALSTYSDLKGDLRPLERARAGHHRGGEGGREVQQGRLAEPHRPLQRRRDAAGARLDPAGRGGRDDLAAGQPVRAASRSSTRSRRSTAPSTTPA